MNQDLPGHKGGKSKIRVHGVSGEKGEVEGDNGEMKGRPRGLKSSRGGRPQGSPVRVCDCGYRLGA